MTIASWERQPINRRLDEFAAAHPEIDTTPAWQAFNTAPGPTNDGAGQVDSA